MNREIINRLIDEVEDLRNGFASGQINPDDYHKRSVELDGRLRIFGLAIADVSHSTPF